jgi:Rrf2 family protein
MRISAKGRYALAAMIHIARNTTRGHCVTVISIAENLGISKIFLEQVFAMLKKGGLVKSVKGAQGGYQLTRQPQLITAYDILAEAEASLFEETAASVPDKAPDIDSAIAAAVFGRLDLAIKKTLQQVTLADLAIAAEKNRTTNSYMYFI